MSLLSRRLRQKRFAMIQPFLHGTVLDIGCGTTAAELALDSVDRYVGVDYNAKLIARLRERCPQHEFHQCDLDWEPLALWEARFDVVLMVAIIEHLANPGPVLEQLAGHLRPKGRLIITTPTPWGERLHRLGARVGLFHPDAAEEHKQAFGRQDLEALLTAHGFSVVLHQPFELGANQLVVGRLADAAQSHNS